MHPKFTLNTWKIMQTLKQRNNFDKQDFLL